MYSHTYHHSYIHTYSHTEVQMWSHAENMHTHSHTHAYIHTYNDGQSHKEWPEVRVTSLLRNEARFPPCCSKKVGAYARKPMKEVKNLQAYCQCYHYLGVDEVLLLTYTCMHVYMCMHEYVPALINQLYNAFINCYKFKPWFAGPVSSSLHLLTNN